MEKETRIFKAIREYQDAGWNGRDAAVAVLAEQVAGLREDLTDGIAAGTMALATELIALKELIRQAPVMRVLATPPGSLTRPDGGPL